MLDHVLNELSRGFASLEELGVVVVRVTLAAIVGGIVGFERSWTGKQAGLRTHMLVCIGSTIFVMVVALEGNSEEALSRVIQGTAAGIGFVGAGAILKLSDRGKVKGITTAANIWLTAALGTAIGAGEFWLSTVGVIAAWIVLTVVDNFEHWMTRKRPNKKLHGDSQAEETAEEGDVED